MERDDPPAARSPFDGLPNEMLAHIFDSLPTCYDRVAPAQVCRRWRALIPHDKTFGSKILSDVLLPARTFGDFTTGFVAYHVDREHLAILKYYMGGCRVPWIFWAAFSLRVTPTEPSAELMEWMGANLNFWPTTGMKAPLVKHERIDLLRILVANGWIGIPSHLRKRDMLELAELAIKHDKTDVWAWIWADVIANPSTSWDENIVRRDQVWLATRAVEHGFNRAFRDVSAAFPPDKWSRRDMNNLTLLTIRKDNLECFKAMYEAYRARSEDGAISIQRAQNCAKQAVHSAAHRVLRWLSAECRGVLALITHSDLLRMMRQERPEEKYKTAQLLFARHPTLGRDLKQADKLKWPYNALQNTLIEECDPFMIRLFDEHGFQFDQAPLPDPWDE